MTLNYFEWPFYVKFSLLQTYFENCYLLIYCRVCLHTHVTSGDVRKRLADRDPQNIWNLRKNCGSFVDATSSEPKQIRPTLLLSITWSVFAFPLTPKHMTLSDLEWPFCVKFCFVPALPAEICAEYLKSCGSFVDATSSEP